MIEKIKPTKKSEEKESATYIPDAKLSTLREIPLDTKALPEPVVRAIEFLHTSQGPIFSDFGQLAPDINDVLLESEDGSVYLAIRVIKDGNWISGIAVNTDDQYSEFYTNMSGEETFTEISLPTAGRESVESISKRLVAVNEFSKERCFTPLYSTSNPHHEALDVWKALEAQGKARSRVMPGGQTQYFLL